MMKQVFQNFCFLNKPSAENHSLEAVILYSLMKYVFIFNQFFYLSLLKVVLQ